MACECVGGEGRGMSLGVCVLTNQLTRSSPPPFS